MRKSGWIKKQDVQKQKPTPIKTKKAGALACSCMEYSFKSF
jgi:hypothetical protein